MIVVMKSGSTQSQVDHVIQLVREMGLKEHVIVGTEQTVVAVIGNDRFKDRTVLETVAGVEKVVPILAPYTSLMIAHAHGTDQLASLGATYDHRVLTGGDVAAALQALSRPSIGDGTAS